MDKVIIFSYKRESLPYSEYQIRKQLEKFLVDDSSSFIITTSTASIFHIVRAFCHMYSWKLTAYYEDTELKMSEGMRMNQWSQCPDFEIIDNCLEVLLTLKTEFENYDLKI